MSAVAEETVPVTTFVLYAELVAAVRASRGWHARIVRETGCRRTTLRRIANDLSYDPPISEVEKIRDWFAAHGVPTHWPSTKLPSSEEDSAAGAA